MEYNPEFATYDYKDNSLDDFNYENEIVADYDVEEALNSQRAAQAELDAANAEMARLEQEAQIDATQAALGVTGLIDPTPVSDLVNAGISWSRGNYGEAMLDGVAAFPLIGDLVAKPFKGGIVARRGINLARKLEKARAAEKAAIQKLADTKKQLQEAAANLNKNKKNAQNAANGKAADAVPPKSKKSQDQVKGDGKKKKKDGDKDRCTLRPYKPDTCAVPVNIVCTVNFDYLQLDLSGFRCTSASGTVTAAGPDHRSGRLALAASFIARRLLMISCALP